jgi:hypothetical protein
MNSLLSVSRQAAVLSCLRKHYWRYEVGLQPECDSLALRLGSAWHRAMEARWRGADYDVALAASVPNGVELDELSVATLSGLLAGYCRHYQSENIIKEVNPEVEFRQPLAGSRTFQLAGKIDGLAVLHDGRLALLEAKTTSDSLAADSPYWLRLRFNLQLLQYVIAARLMGWDVATIIYDVVRKPSIVPKQIPLTDERGLRIVLDGNGQRVLKKDGSPRESGDTEKGYTLQLRAETPQEYSKRLFEDTLARPEFYFARREVPILEGDLDEFQEQRLALSRIILHCRNSQKRFKKPERAWPRNVSELTCRRCSFADFCLQNISVDLAQPPSGFKVSDPNPELKQTAAA